MSLLTLTTREDIPRLLPMVAAFHEEVGLDTTEELREASLNALWDLDIQAAIWLIGPKRAPVGYLAVGFGYSISLGGREARIDEFFIRSKVRGRGMGTQALGGLLPALHQMGVRALHADLALADATARKLFERAGLRPFDAEMVARAL